MSHEIGDKVTIHITGMLGRFEAEVVDFDTRYGNHAPLLPVLKLTHPMDGWEDVRLKDGDYIIVGGKESQ